MLNHFGAEIRERRSERGLSLRSLASKVGISPSMLSQVETGKLTPSLGTLFDIASYLGISIDALLGLEKPVDESGALPWTSGSPVQTSDEYPCIELEDGITWQRITWATGTRISSMLVTFKPGSTSSVSGTLTRSSGTEQGFITKGELTLFLDGNEHLIREGDSFCFDGRRAHLFVNKSDEVTEGIWFSLDAHDHDNSRSIREEAHNATVSATIRALKDPA